MTHQGHAGLEEVEVLDKGRAHDRVLAHDRQLASVQRARLQQYGVGNAELADVMHREAEGILVHQDPRRNQVEQGGRVVGDPLDVSAGVAIAQLDSRRQRAYRLLLAPAKLSCQLLEPAVLGAAPRWRCPRGS
jgi:hypothetical protein